MSILYYITRFNNVQIPKPAMTGHLSCQAAFAPQQGQPVIAGSTVRAFSKMLIVPASNTCTCNYIRILSTWLQNVYVPN